MFRVTQKALVIFIISVLILTPFASTALADEYFEKENSNGGMMIYDAVVVRPVGIVATAVGSVFFIVSLPFSLLGQNTDEAAQALVKDPAAYTFSRPLGEF